MFIYLPQFSLPNFSTIKVLHHTIIYYLDDNCDDFNDAYAKNILIKFELYFKYHFLLFSHARLRPACIIMCVLINYDRFITYVRR